MSDTSLPNDRIDEIIRLMPLGLCLGEEEPYDGPRLRLIAKTRPEQFPAENLRKLQQEVKSVLGVSLRFVAMIPSCTKIVLIGDPRWTADTVTELMNNPKFQRIAQECGFSLIVSDKLQRVHLLPEQNKAKRFVDFAILTALVHPEFKALRARLNQIADKETVTPIGSATYYHYSIPTVGGGTISAIATFQPRMGNAIASSITQSMIREWSPTFLGFVGIAGGLHRDVELGDVIVADQVVHYDSRRMEGEAGTQFAPSGYQIDRLLLNRAQALQIEDAFYDSWAAQFETKKGRPRLHFGDLACGDAVVNSQAYKDKLTALNRKLLAVEMEAAGFLEAAITEATRAFVVRGISDLASKKESSDEETRFRAADAAAAFLATFLRSFTSLGESAAFEDEKSRKGASE